MLRKANNKAKSEAMELKIDDRVKQFSNRNSYILTILTMKDLKDSFLNQIKYRLIDPVITEIGIINKHYLKRNK